MRLKKLQNNDIESIKNKKIYIYEKSISYLDELHEKYGIYEQIEMVIDDNARNQGTFGFKGRTIPVQGFDSIFSLSAADTWQESRSDRVILITSDYYIEAYEKLCADSAVSENIDTIYYFENKETACEMGWREKYKEHELENIIIFRSGPHASSYIEGTDFCDNARALFEYMLANEFNKKYELIWLVKHPEDFAKYSRYENISFLSFDWSISDDETKRSKYYRALCLAKYIFFTDAYGFARNCRKDQIRVQLWHGCGFKTRVNFVRCEKRYEYTTVISGLYARIHQDIYGLREDQTLITGYAKQDWLFEELEEEKWEWLRIPADNKCIFWLPTFRAAAESLNSLSEKQMASETGLPVVNTMDRLIELNDFLENENITLIIKLHPFQNKETVHCKGLSNIILMDNYELFVRDIQINQMLSKADALISDYSSAAVDYMLLDRPIAFTLDDVDEYASGRGFVFDNIPEWLPGVLLYTFDEFCGFIKEIAIGDDTTKYKRRMLTAKMHKFHDGNSCRRILESLGINMEI